MTHSGDGRRINFYLSTMKQLMKELKELEKEKEFEESILAIVQTKNDRYERTELETIPSLEQQMKDGRALMRKLYEAFTNAGGILSK